MDSTASCALLLHKKENKQGQSVFFSVLEASIANILLYIAADILTPPINITLLFDTFFT